MCIKILSNINYVICSLVNGGWSLWGQFSECTVTCNGGTQFRTRFCNNPTPDPEGIPCNTSEGTELLSCHEQQCPSKNVLTLFCTQTGWLCLKYCSLITKGTSVPKHFENGKKNQSALILGRT